MATRQIGKYVAEFVANTHGFRTPITTATRDLQMFESGLASTLSTASLLGAGIGAAIAGAAAGIAGLLKSSIDTADELGKMSERVGISVESLSALRYTAELSDVSMRELEGGIKRMEINLAALGKEAKKTGDHYFRMVGHEMNETAEAADQSNAAFRELGISFKEMKELSKNPDKALTSILDKIGKIENKSERAAIAKKIFGTTSFLNIPAGGMDEMIALARKHHQLVTGKTAAEAAAFKDAMTKVQNSFTGIFNVLIQGGRLEIITRFLERSADAIGNMAEGIDSILGNLNQFPNLKSTLGRSAGFEFIDALMDALGNNKNGSREMMKKLLMY